MTDQGWGKVTYASNDYVQKTDNAEVLKIFKNKNDDKWYTKDHQGNITPFPPGGGIGNSKFVKGLFNQANVGNAIGDLQQNDINSLTSITLTRVGTGHYELDLSSLGYSYQKVNYYISQNEVKTWNKIINMQYGADSVLRVYTSLSDGTLSDDILSNTPFLLEFFN